MAGLRLQTPESPAAETIGRNNGAARRGLGRMGPVTSLPPSPAPARVLVVQPDPSDPLERWGPWLSDCGVAIHVVRPFAGEPVPPRLEVDGLIVLGGDMSVHDTADHPWLEDIATLLRDAVDRELPTLGMCLGGQLLAHVLGGVVARGHAGVEAGVAEIEVRPDAGDDSLMGGLGRLPMGSMHDDAVHELPEGSCWLAASAQYPHQAFRVGASAWGVQFHPEISPTTYESWAGLYDSSESQDRDRVLSGVDAFAAHDAEVRSASRVMARRFAEVVLRTRAARTS